ncbi:hydroxymethylbilane synthase [Ruicaihuangia caeni]|uniref:Hydroxymethylbilane synthase n=1 Tax=Ruicaihuangia caeni TaxID=3042517 RepID=A0AAW6T3R5_9MICO|nr:hydroxymethylbilane synthase [Klugiella sp. YN-L-19]MDI2098362.1 hydroxymethylbilane synthase [Klugiella sp. YN-L-19]
MSIRVGSRDSALALAQTQSIVERLARKAGTSVEIVPVHTESDGLAPELAPLDSTGVFVSALRTALTEGECDVVVHSLSDVPTTERPDLSLAAIVKRGDARDSLCARDGLTLETLDAGARVGVGSPLARAQLRSKRAELEPVDVLGDLDSRLARVENGELDAVIVGAAALTRLGRGDAATESFSLSEWPTKAAQGALALEVRRGDEKLVSALDHRATRLTTTAERAVLERLRDVCAAPLGVTAELDNGLLFVSARAYSSDGSRELTSSHALYPDDSKNPAAELAARIVDELVGAGVAELG